jgi:hypothetical protein
MVDVGRDVSRQGLRHAGLPNRLIGGVVEGKPLLAAAHGVTVPTRLRG